MIQAIPTISIVRSMVMIGSAKSLTALNLMRKYFLMNPTIKTKNHPIPTPLNR